MPTDKTPRRKPTAAVSKAAAALSALQRGVPRQFSPEYLETLKARLAAARAKRLKLIAARKRKARA